MTEAFWCEERGLFSDDLEKTDFNEHGQLLAILSSRLDDATANKVLDTMLADDDIDRVTIYFMHYLFEVCYRLERPDVFFDRMQAGFDLEKKGFKAPPEMPENTRADLFGWGGHPLAHYYTTILGIQPASAGFRTVSIRPQLGHLTHARGTTFHPRGKIEVDFRVDDGQLHGAVTLPPGVKGTLFYGGESRPLEGTTLLGREGYRRAPFALVKGSDVFMERTKGTTRFAFREVFLHGLLL